MILDTTSKTVEVILGEAHTTSALRINADWNDVTTTTFVPGSTRNVTNGTTKVTVIASPAASTQRQPTMVSVYNADTVTHNITIQAFDGTNTDIVIKGSVQVGQTLYWTARANPTIFSTSATSGVFSFVNGSASAPSAYWNTNYGLFYDTTNTGLGISIAGSQIGYFNATGLTLSKAGGTQNSLSLTGEGATSILMQRYSADTTAPAVTFMKARGTIASPAVPVTSDVAGQLTGQLYSGAGFSIGGQFQFLVAETATVDATHLGTLFRIRLCAVGGSSLNTVTQFDNENGQQMFGSIVIDQNRLHVFRAYTVAALPTGVQPYSRAFVTNATLGVAAGLGLAPVGGGANKTPVYTTDGTNWVIG